MKRVHGFKRPTQANHAYRAEHHLQGGAGVTPESKGFRLKEACDVGAITGPVLDQGEVGDCVDNAVSEGLTAALVFYGHAAVKYSVYFLYAMLRLLTGVPLTEDSGSSVTDGIQTAMRIGICREEFWPSTDPQGWTKEPSSAAKDDALKHRATRCYSLSTTRWIMACLSLGFPVIFGVSLPESFWSIGDDGYMPLPHPDEPFRGHCMIATGYRKRADGLVDFRVKNSWGVGFADGGYVWMPQEFFDQGIAMDAWTIHEEKFAA